MTFHLDDHEIEKTREAIQHDLIWLILFIEEVRLEESYANRLKIFSNQSTSLIRLLDSLDHKDRIVGQLILC